MKFHNKFLGLDNNNVTVEFIGGDTKEMFSDNLQHSKPDWYYKDQTITYTHNKNGHRCKNIEDLDLSNYILFAGCSHTYGVGLKLEHTYPYIIAKELNCDYYNLSIGGAGIDVLEYNVLSWFGLIKEKPKLVFIQMPDHSRFAGYNPYVASDDIYFIEKGSWSDDRDEQEMVVNCETVGLYNARKALTYKLIDSIIDVPLIKANIWAHDNICTTSLKMRTLDKARDLSHMGILSNKKFATDVLSYLKTEYPNKY